MKSDLALLGECLGEAALQEETREAFEEMQAQLESGRYRGLTTKQRAWVERVHAALKLDPGVENLVTTGKVKPTAAERASLRNMIDSLGPKPLRPPGMK